MAGARLNEERRGMRAILVGLGAWWVYGMRVRRDLCAPAPVHVQDRILLSIGIIGYCDKMHNIEICLFTFLFVWFWLWIAATAC